MPNLVGTGLNQVPTNSMLGGMAYQDPEHASIKNLDLKNLSQINSEIDDTAVDIFVYDTSKDSDSGAWRKKTTHTSWYNETLGTATRGTRKEFPAVAVIVAEAHKVTIYDGDDPDLPMWMVFKDGVGNSAANTTFLGVLNVPISSILMLNGVLCVGFSSTGGWGVSEIGFVSDSQRWWWTAGIYKQSINLIYERNVGSAYVAVDTSASVKLVNAVVKDVAMTVLPNAPIDDTTGLPIPTIAVATNNGLSVITDSGSVFDITSGTIIHHEPRGVDFFGSRIFWTEGNNYDLQDRAFLNASIPSADIVLTHNGALPGGYIGYGLGGGANNIFNNYAFLLPLNNEPATRQRKFQIGGPDNNIFLGCKHAVNGGIEHIHQNIESPSNGMVVTTTSSYNTGWMHGDCKGAFLSDTDTTNVTGAELITNGTFDSNTTGWGSANGSTLTQQSNGNPGGNINVASGVSSNGYASQTNTTVVGKYYTLSFDHYHVNGSSGYVNIGTSTGGSEYVYQTLGTSSSWTTYSFTIKATTTSTFTGFYSRPNGNVRYDNISLREADPDRSVNNNGPQVFGTVTKSAVATGAELVAYSGFTASSYLKYNASDMAFGTGDFSVSVWCIPSTDQSNEFILELDDASVQRFYFLVTNTTTKRLYLPWNADVAGSELTTGQWNHVVVGRRSGTGFVYVNGDNIPAGSVAWSGDLQGNGFGTISNYSGGPSNDYAWSGSLALLRISGSVPTAEQIKKMYEDEKVLFQENAKATLYGSSDAVTALAFDDTTNLLHAGTSAGRSEFQGLRRINNTTDAVTTAISASNGLVAEQ